MKIGLSGATLADHGAGLCKSAVAATMVLSLLMGAAASPALADKSVLPEGTYDSMFLVHLAIVAQANCSMLKVSSAAMQATSANATQHARAETGLSYPDIAGVYETSEFDREIGERVDSFLKKYPGDDICFAISRERAVNSDLGKIVRLKND